MNNKARFKQQQKETFSGFLEPGEIMQIFRWPEEETASNRGSFLNGQSNFTLFGGAVENGPGSLCLRCEAAITCGRDRIPEALFFALIWGLSDNQFRSFPVLARFACILFLAIAHVMHSLNQEIKAFSRNNLRKQCTRVTTLTGKKIIETWKDARIHVVEEVEPSSGGSCGYVQDLSLDLHVGVIKPWLLLGEYIDLALTYWLLLDILLFRPPPPECVIFCSISYPAEKLKCFLF